VAYNWSYLNAENDSSFKFSTFNQSEIDMACRKGLQEKERETSAPFAANGSVALNALRSIYRAGMSTPEDIAFATLCTKSPLTATAKRSVV
jgi:DNA-binding LacI/PurR family transcriptional regulator